MGLLTTQQVGDRLGVSIKRVQQFISEGRLPAQRFGRVFLVDEKDLKLVKDRKPGRPKASISRRAARPRQKNT